ncbi:alpha/beta hydrolase [Frigoribacterium sp. VKM Ac-2530]|uniref:alpha/beta hydrolase n=1 Tax=Frigoribacterium sp. VKM Ac-2530 TaxID=2783822 RepID=UPI001889E335|nr:alpha/beta hydrolase [Frigoribacterium sp. VKM Ac-2530]MBF4580875.1 alpha/beta hydrolase [Frigoribacterium sp. VKM Ac-2530]
MDILFVHGALVRDGRWWWRPTADLMEAESGIRSRSLALPSCGDRPADGRDDVRVGSDAGGGAGVAGDEDGPATGLVADAAALRRALDEASGPGEVIVVAHSYGGTVVAEAGAHPAVAHLLLVSSYLPDVGQSQGAVMGGETDPVPLGDAGAGRLGLVGDLDAPWFGARFLQDGTPEQQREAFSRVVPQDAASFTTPTTRAGWQGVDSTYLVCADDRSTSVGLQREHAARATRSVELPTGHHPFVTRPDLVVEQLRAFA